MAYNKTTHLRNIAVREGYYCRDIRADGTVVDPYGSWTFEESREAGFRFHVRCDKDDPGATEDLNRAETHREGE